MNKILWALPMVVLLATLARAEKGCCKGGCPMGVKGAQTVVENTADGVTIRITAKDPAAIKKIQESAAAHAKMAASGKMAHKAGWVCPMGCAHSDKPGKCPKCGMDMKPEGEKTEAKKP